MNSERIAGLRKPLSRLVQGTLFLEHAKRDACFALFDAAFAAGCTAFDTAAVYGAGDAERVLGAWLDARGLASQVVVIDKGCHPRDWQPRMTPAALHSDLDASRARLALERIDLYLLHRDDPSVPPDEIVDALNDAVREGKISAFGASNWTHQRLARANDYARRNGLLPFAVSSPGLSLAEPLASWPGCVSLHRLRDAEALRWYAEQRMPLLAWSPLASGFLSGRFQRGADALPSLGADRAALEFYASDANFERLERLQRLASERGVSVATAAVAYVLNAAAGVHAVVGCRNEAELAECRAALALALASRELDWLDSGVGQP